MSLRLQQKNLLNLITELAVIFSLLAGIFMQTSCAGLTNSMQMVIKDPRSETVYYSLDIKPGATFTLRYRHSVSGSPVEGTFFITRNGKIKPITTTYSSFGPGLPMDYAENYTIENGLITVYHDEDPRDHIRLWVSPQTEEMILLNDRKYPLSTLAESHLLLDIAVVVTNSPKNLPQKNPPGSYK